jgi:hypothetical protein
MTNASDNRNCEKDESPYPLWAMLLAMIAALPGCCGSRVCTVIIEGGGPLYVQHDIDVYVLPPSTAAATEPSTNPDRSVSDKSFSFNLLASRVVEYRNEQGQWPKTKKELQMFSEAKQPSIPWGRIKQFDIIEHANGGQLTVHAEVVDGTGKPVEVNMEFTLH